jgi:hypothetical protein
MKRNDWILLLSVLLIAVVTLVVSYVLLGGKGSVAVVTVDGEEVARDLLKTAEAPAEIKVTPDYSECVVGGYLELSVEIVDKNGTVVPGTYDFLRVETEGCERFAMVSDNLYDSTCHDTDEYMVFEGRCKIIVKITDAESLGLKLKYADITKEYVYRQ